MSRQPSVTIQDLIDGFSVSDACEEAMDIAVRKAVAARRAEMMKERRHQMSGLHDDTATVQIAAVQLAKLRLDQKRLEYVLWRHFRDADWEATAFSSRDDIDKWIAAETEFTGEVTE